MVKKLKPSFSSQRGVVQLPILIGLLILAIALPATTRLVQERQEIREKATESECQTDADCDDDNLCTTDTCAADGSCVNTDVADETSCGTNAVCTSGICFCQTGYDDCDGDINNGCEADLMTNKDSCGSCVNQCAANEVCQNGTCEYESECQTDADCDDDNLCTTDTCAADGSCEYTPISCNENAECNSSTGNCQCSFDTVGNCDDNWDNGCETLLTNNKEHCGSCGNACPKDYVCLQRECADIGIYPVCLIKNTSDELGIDMKYISNIEDNNAQWGEEDACEEGNREGKKLVLQSLYPDSNNKCWQYEYHTAGSADDLAIHCVQYRTCETEEIDCPQCPANADFNDDGKVDEFDYGILIAHFGDEGIPGEVVGDANCDGVVDEFDYGILIAHFGEGE